MLAFDLLDELLALVIASPAMVWTFEIASD
jgi:hypothetical protein